MASNPSKLRSESELLDAFRASGTALVVLLAKENFETRLSREPTLPVFSALPFDQKILALARLETMLDLCRETLARKQTLGSSTALLETFFDRYSLNSVDGLFENIQEDDSAEVYDTNHQLIFANLSAFRLVSFTLEDVYCRPWTELLTRDTRGVHESLMKVGTEIIEGKRTALTSTAFIPDHVSREINSPENRSVIVFPNFFAPLYQQGTIAGYVCVNKLFPHTETKPD